MEKQVAALEARFADPTLYARDPAGFDDTAAALTKAREDKVAAEEAWLELELLREEIESG